MQLTDPPSGAAGSVLSESADDPRRRRILDRLSALEPVDVECVNVSHEHAGHAGVAASSTPGQTHYRVRVVSECFVGMRSLLRHRMVNQALREEFENGLHALTIHAQTPQEAGLI